MWQIVMDMDQVHRDHMNLNQHQLLAQLMVHVGNTRYPDTTTTAIANRARYCMENWEFEETLWHGMEKSNQVFTLTDVNQVTPQIQAALRVLEKQRLAARKKAKNDATPMRVPKHKDRNGQRENRNDRNERNDYRGNNGPRGGRGGDGRGRKFYGNLSQHCKFGAACYDPNCARMHPRPGLQQRQQQNGQQNQAPPPQNVQQN